MKVVGWFQRWWFKGSSDGYMGGVRASAGRGDFRPLVGLERMESVWIERDRGCERKNGR